MYKFVKLNFICKFAGIRDDRGNAEVPKLMELVEAQIPCGILLEE